MRLRHRQLIALCLVGSLASIPQAQAKVNYIQMDDLFEKKGEGFTFSILEKVAPKLEEKETVTEEVTTIVESSSTFEERETEESTEVESEMKDSLLFDSSVPDEERSTIETLIQESGLQDTQESGLYYLSEGVFYWVVSEDTVIEAESQYGLPNGELIASPETLKGSVRYVFKAESVETSGLSELVRMDLIPLPSTSGLSE